MDWRKRVGAADLVYVRYFNGDVGCEEETEELYFFSEGSGKMRKIELVFLVAVMAVAVFLRVMYVPQGDLTFGFDQARDAYTAEEILGGDVKVQGPSASTPGLFHGVLYDYILVLPYAVSHDPRAAAYWVAFLSCLGVIWVYLLGRELLGRKGVGAAAAVLYAVGFKQVQYGTWLSNPTIAVSLVPILYLALWKAVKSGGRGRWVILTGLALGGVIQSEIFLAYHLPVVVYFLAAGGKRIDFKKWVAFFASLGLGVGTIIISQLKFGMTAVAGLSSLFTGPTRPFGYERLGDYILLYINQFGETFTKDIFPLNEGWGGGWGLVVLISLLIWALRFRANKKGPNPYLFLVLWLLSHMTVVALGGVTTPFMTVGLGAAAGVGTAVVLSKWWEGGRRWVVVGLFLVFCGANVYKVVKDDVRGATLFAIQPDMLLVKQQAVVDWTYQTAGGEQFSINTVTSPLWINTVWAYLYNWYGKEKYGYVPEWHGRDQVGRQGSLPAVSEATKLYYLIKEPPEGIPPSFIQGEEGTEEARSQLLEEKNFGEMVVQKRLKRET